LAEENKTRGVDMFERNGWFVLKKDVSAKKDGTKTTGTKPRTKCPFQPKRKLEHISASKAPAKTSVAPNNTYNMPPKKVPKCRF
jgi:hypothetical protein